MLTVILFFTIVLVIGLDLNIFSQNPPDSIKSKSISKIKNNILPSINENNASNQILTSKKSPIFIPNQENNLTEEIVALVSQANQFFQDSKDSDAIKIYQEIIKKTEQSKDIKILEQFANACLQIAFLYQVYPNSDKDASIEAYNILIKRFEKSDNSELLKIYIDAQISQSYLLDKDERVEINDELIQKFENHKDVELQKKIEDLLLNKSFELMGQDDEEAMQILDNIIEKYQNQHTTSIPNEIGFAILNNLELSIITNNDDQKYIELANTYLADSPDTKPLLEMLEIIKNSQNIDQEDALAQWKNNYQNYAFPDWSFQELRRWSRNMEDKESQDRVKSYIDIFERQQNQIEKEEHQYKKINQKKIDKIENSNDSVTYQIDTIEEEEKEISSLKNIELFENIGLL